jgi:hypothetical protein
VAQISPNVSSGPYTADGSQTAFPFSFSIIDARQILVKVDGEPLSTLAGYTVAFGDTSGTVTFGTAPAAGAQVFFVSNPDYLQTSNFASQGAYNLDAVNQINRRAAIRALVLKTDILRSVKGPVSSILPELPALEDGEGRVIGIADGQFVYVPNDAVAVAGDVAAAQAARTGAETAEGIASAAATSVTAAAALLPVRFQKSSDETITADATLNVDADLQVPLPANTTRIITGKLFYTTTAAADFKFRHTGPAGAVRVRVKRLSMAPGDTTAVGLTDTAYSAADIVVAGGAGSGVIELTAAIENGATSGNFGISWSQNTSDAGNTTLEKESYLESAPVPQTTIYALNNAAIASIGEFTPSAGSPNFVSTVQPGDSFVEFDAHGSKCDMQINGTGGETYTVVVDGGTPFVLSPSAVWQWGNIFTGLSDAAHNVHIYGKYFNADQAVRVTGFAPALSRPAAIPNFFALDSSSFTTNGIAEGMSAIVSAFYSNMRLWTRGGGSGLRVKATTTSVRVFTYGLGQRIILEKDGVGIADVRAPNDGHFRILDLATGLSGSHEYKAYPVDAGIQCFMKALLVDSIDAVAHPARPLHKWYGHSFVAEDNSGATFDARTGDAYLVAQAAGAEVVRYGAGGAVVANTLRDGTANITGTPGTAAKYYIDAGVNDLTTGVAAATFQTAYQTMIENLYAADPGKPIRCIGIGDMSPALAHYSSLGTFNTAIQSAVTAAKASTGYSDIKYIAMTGVIVVATDTSDTTLHPNALGYAKRATVITAAA